MTRQLIYDKLFWSTSIHELGIGIMSEHQADHNIIEYILTLLDISGQVKANPDFFAALQEGQTSLSGQRLPAMLDEYQLPAQNGIIRFMNQMPGGFFIYHADDEEQIIYVNQALLRIFHCDTIAEFRQLTGNSFKGMVHPDDLEAVEASIIEQISDSKYDLDYVEYRIRCKDGAIRWIEDYGHFVRSETIGNIFYVFISDATEKRQKIISDQHTLVQNATAESEMKLRTLMKSYDEERNLIYQEHLRRLEVIEGLSVNYESILYVDLNTDKILPYRMSVRTERLFEASVHTLGFSDYITDYVKAWVHPEDRNLVAKVMAPDYIREKLAESKTYYMNYRIIHNSETQYLQLRVVNVGSHKNISQIVIGYRRVDDEIMQEIKQQQVLEEALEQAKSANRTKDTFLSNMSHDMRTPLNAVFGYTALARKHLDDPATVENYLDKIDIAGRQLLDMIEQILEISWMESSETQLTETEFRLTDLVNEIKSTAQPQAADKEIVIDTDLSRLQHCDVYGDYMKLSQLIMNLVNNAIKYTENNGRIDVIVREKELLPNDLAVFQFVVKDTGIGISREFLEHIFDPFQRERNTTFSGIYGTGLGLTIAKNIAEMMNGTIEAESTPGEGSAFTVTLTLRLNGDRSPLEQTSDSILLRLAGQKILLVDDNEINLEIETELLQELGFRIEQANDGIVAVEKLKASKPGEFALVLMDIQMPLMDGRKATETIRRFEDPVLSRIPIIALSANAFESDKRLSTESGMNAHLTKPIDVPILLETIARILPDS